LSHHCGAILVVFFVLGASITAAQEMPAEHQHDAPERSGWSWATDANAFVGYNYQQRQFLDYAEWESQNWFMVEASRSARGGQLTAHGMLSLERFTMRGQGSPQLFQTGESYKQVPLINYQHPHDLVMALGATYRRRVGRGTYVLGVDLVGSPTLGPTPFMHRPSARNNPQVPITHHYLDSTHITAGVVRVGVGIGPLMVESSLFRGAEPNDNRLDIERPRLDSWALRAHYARGSWRAQVSGGHMRQPEWFEPYDLTRITASIAFYGEVGSRPASLTLAWGGNRQFNGFNGDADGYLLEGDIRALPASTVYGRVEVADKELFGVAPHPKGSSHPHAFFKVAAATAGYIRELPIGGVPIGLGADVTFYRMPELLDQFWKGSHSYHVFLRWRPTTKHIHH
jgi:hypothetical protein